MKAIGALLAVIVGASVTNAAAPTDMQAILSMGPEDVKLQRVPVPEPAAGQVLVQIYAAAVNPTDWKQRVIPAGQPPRIPGRDVAGVIARLGAGVSQFKVGDAVWGQVAPVPNATMNGAYAQYAVAPAADFAAKPQRLTFAEASGLGIATVTGVRAVNHARVASGQRVLVTGAAGGVGSAAVQAAKARGAYVIGTASGRHGAYLKGIGVDEHIDYTAGDWVARIRNIDAVIDTVNADNAKQALQTMKRGGNLVAVAGGPGAEVCAAAGVTCQSGSMGQMNLPPAAGAASTPGAATAPTAAGNPVIEEILRLADAGKLNVAIDASYPLAEAAKAWDANRKGSTQGKIILIVDAANASRK